jgi:aldose 1-epimerase
MSVSGSIDGHRLEVAADQVLAGPDLPKRTLVDCAGTVFDLRRPRALGDVAMDLGQGLDHSYALARSGGSEGPAAILHDPASGRTLTVRTDQPALHVYTADGLGLPFAPRSAVCLEAQRFPDAPNRPDLGLAWLHAGESYQSTTSFTFGAR